MFQLQPKFVINQRALPDNVKQTLCGNFWFGFEISCLLVFQRLFEQKIGSFFVVSAEQESGVTPKTDYRLFTHVGL